MLVNPLNNSQTSTTTVPSSQSVQLQIGQNNSNSLVPHSQSAYEIGQALTHQQALHQQLQQRFANVNSNSGNIGEVITREKEESNYYQTFYVQTSYILLHHIVSFYIIWQLAIIQTRMHSV